MFNQHLHHIEQLLSIGDIQQAQQINNKQIKEFPEELENKYCEGLIALMSGNADQALASFQEVEKQYLSSAKFYNNFGKAALDQDDAEKARELFLKAVELVPDNILARYNLACAYIRLEKGTDAALILDDLSSKYPDNVEYLCACADAARIEGKYRKAVRLYKSTLKIEPQHISANSNLGALLVYFGKEEESLEYCRKATTLAPELALAHLNLGRCLVRLERFDEAMDAFADAFELEPESPFICTDIAAVWLSSGDLNESSAWYKRAVTFSPDFAPALAGIARILLDTDNVAAALVLLEEKLEIHPDNIELNRAYADALWDDGDASAALKVLDGMQISEVDDPWLLSKRAQLLASTGAVSESLDCYKKALDLNPRCIPALSGLAVKQKGKFDSKMVAKMKNLLLSKSLKDGSKASLHNGLAYYYDGQKKWQDAAKHMASANKFQWSHQSKRSWDYDQKAHRENFENIRKAFTKEYFDSMEGFGSESEQPVFIVGMPRSGTTLTEQILARHSKALGIGERNFAAQSFSSLTQLKGVKQKNQSTPLSLLTELSKQDIQFLANGYLQKLDQLKNRDGDENVIRVVDKMPDNYSLMGWILTLFPRAKIIHCRRNPRDVALSCWMTQFGKIQWASRIDDLCHRISQYHLMMDHWRSTIPDRFIEIDYEDMVENQEQVSKKLINWIGLEWDEACLKFYESDRIVRTASITQVRNPIYKSSVARWKTYTLSIPELLTIQQS